MSIRERFLKCMHFEPVDRPINLEWSFWASTIERWLREGMPIEAVPRKTRTQLLLGTAYSRFAPSISWTRVSPYRIGHLIDRRLRVFGAPFSRCLPINSGPIPPFRKRVLEETDRYILFRDQYGNLRRALKGTDYMDTYIDFPVKTREDFEEIKKRFDPHDPRRYPKNWPEIVARYPNNRDVIISMYIKRIGGLYSTGRLLMGTMGISKAFFSMPNLVHEMFDFTTDFVIELIHKALHEIQVDYYNIFEDFAYKNGPHLSPLLFKEFLLPRYKRITSFLRKHGVDIIILDSDGNTEPLIPLIIEAGITCQEPLEQAAGMDPRKIRREYGHDFALIGGIDKREIAKGKGAIEREVMSKIPDLVADGGYIPTLDHNVSPDISYQNFLYYLKVKQQAMQQSRK